MARQERTVSIFNATFEKWRLGYDSRFYTFEPRDFTEVSDEFAEVIEHDYKDHGLVAIYNGDDFKAAERKALISYLGMLTQRIRNYQAEWDEFKRNGVTIPESTAWKRAIRWKQEITNKLNMEAPLEIEKSFMDDSDLKSNIFSTPPTIETVEQKFKRKVGRPKLSSFTDTDIENEIGV